jgi:hypothetical protein
MKVTCKLSIAIAAWSLALAAHADCPFPKAPATMPNGNSASKEEMVEAMAAFKAYNDEVTAFGICLENETKSKSVASSQLRLLKTMQKKKHNAAFDELQAKVKEFNEQLRIFKSRG